MTKLTFDLETLSSKLIGDLLKEVYQVHMDTEIIFEKGYLSIIVAEDEQLDAIIELLKENCSIVPDAIEKKEEQIVEPVLEEKEEDKIISGGFSIQTVNSNQAEDIEFESEKIVKMIENYLRTIHNALYQKRIPENYIIRKILSANNAIYMNNIKNHMLSYSIGDIVECNYSSNFDNEINGPNVAAIVCDIKDGRPYILPLVKERRSLKKEFFENFSDPLDGVFYHQLYKSSIVILNRGQYVDDKRFWRVIGKTHPAFFNKLLDRLSGQCDFRCNKKLENKETAIKSILEPTLFKLQGLEKNIQVQKFLANIGMDFGNEILVNAFKFACEVKKINYRNIISRLQDLYPEKTQKEIKENLKMNFNIWLKNYPELRENYPTISIMEMMKIWLES